jgi:tryptophanyl-tRNA synthetase
MDQAKLARKPRIFSGIQSTGNIHIGNYIGAFRNFKLLEPDYDCLYSIVDLHAITVRQEPAALRKSCVELMALYLAVGLNPEKSLIFMQSHVPAHAELAWILNCFTYMGELGRMTQYKEKARKHSENINAGLFDYPVLMAADILIYQSDLVPVGDDQKQHLELTRDIAGRMNGLYGSLFTVPEVYIPKVGARIMSLIDPTGKMSKSDPDETVIALMDKPDIVLKKLKRAVTDSENAVRYDIKNKPGVSNLMTIMSALTGMGFDDIEKTYGARGYGVFKAAVADAIIATLEPIQEKYSSLIVDKAYLNDVMTNSARRAAEMADATMRNVRKKIGLAPLSL